MKLDFSALTHFTFKSAGTSGDNGDTSIHAGCSVLERWGQLGDKWGHGAPCWA